MWFVTLLVFAFPTCEHEDSTNCVWSANVQGNERGNSFVNLNGVIINL